MIAKSEPLKVIIIPNDEETNPQSSASKSSSSKVFVDVLVSTTMRCLFLLSILRLLNDRKRSQDDFCNVNNKLKSLLSAR